MVIYLCVTCLKLLFKNLGKSGLIEFFEIYFLFKKLLKMYTINQFARLLVKKFAKLGCTPDDLLILGDESIQDIFDSIDRLMYYYFVEIMVINIESIEDKLASKEAFMKHVLSRCLELSKENGHDDGHRTFFEFLLVSIYTGKVAENLFLKYASCKLLKWTANCLEAAYCREYESFFQENEGFAGCANFCRRFNECPASASLENEVLSNFKILDPKKIKKVWNFENLIQVEDDKVSLNDMEIELFIEQPIENCCPNRGNEFPIESSVAATYSDVKNRVCDYCDSNCFDYPKCSKPSGSDKLEGTLPKLFYDSVTIEP